jgi:outer membrane protein TolC
MVRRHKLIVLLCFTWWTCPSFLGRDMLNGQILRNSEGAGDRAVTVLSPQTATAPTGSSPVDSLEMALLDIEIRKAKERVSETSFWKRIIPQIHVSGSFGVRDVVFIDPTTFTPFILPRDAYRLTVSLSLSEVLNFSKHSLAELELDKLSTERTYQTLRKALLRKSIEQQLTELHEQLEFLREEVGIVQELLRFNQLRFEQGKIEFDTLMRTRLELLSVQKAIHRIEHQKSDLQLKLYQGETQ